MDVLAARNENIVLLPARISQLYLFTMKARGGAISSGIALQAVGSRVRFPMVSLEFFIDIILPAALWHWG